jgi:Zn-dependent protease
MLPQSQGCFRLFKIAGITVLLHWSWLLVGGIGITYRAKAYSSLAWNVAEYLALFGIVLMHEFGHVLACRSVGGQADQIILWPLGGVAYVNPPPRPGALLWSIAAGPLVNVALLPVTIGLCWLVPWLLPLHGEIKHFCFAIATINLVLLGFNMLPIYPLDGGQMLHALLWFPLGRARSLLVCSAIGLIGAVGLFAMAVYLQSIWLIVLAAFLGFQAWKGLQQAQILNWLQPVAERLDAGVEALRQEDCAGALTAANAALALIPEEHPLRANAYHCRALALAKSGDLAGAAADLDEAIRLQPDVVQHYLQRGMIRAQCGQYTRAEDDYREAVHLDPNSASAVNNLAWLWATCPQENVRNGAKAVKYATRACELTNWREPNCLATLAAAYAESGDFASAATWHKKALEYPAYRRQYGDSTGERVELYETGKPFRETPAL